MKNFIFILLLCLTAAFLTAQKTVIVSSDCEPQSYQTTLTQYTPDVGDCNVKMVGPLYPVVPTEGMMYTTLQCMAGYTYHSFLPLGFGTGPSQGLNIIYMNPYLYQTLGEAEALKRAKAAGFPCAEVVRLQAANEFPNFQFN
jgi:hypothetical protein